MLRLKLHILLFLCPGRLLPFLLFLPDTLLPAFQALHYFCALSCMSSKKESCPKIKKFHDCGLIWYNGKKGGGSRRKGAAGNENRS